MVQIYFLYSELFYTTYKAGYKRLHILAYLAFIWPLLRVLKGRDVCMCVPRCVRVEKKNQLDATEWFIALMLNMFRAPLCPSSGGLDYMCVITALVARCWGVRCRAMRPG